MSEAQREMPRYRSHKVVHALQIDTVEDYRLTFIDPEYAPIEVEPEVFSRYRPEHGDYLVVYPDGYRSVSPRGAFEDGYTRVD